MLYGISLWRRNIVVGNNIIVRMTPRTGRKTFMVFHQNVGLHRNGQNKVNQGFSPIARDLFPSYLFIPSPHAPRTLLIIMNLSPQTR
jgi:hypothetical protein